MGAAAEVVAGAAEDVGAVVVAGADVGAEVVAGADVWGGGVDVSVLEQPLINRANTEMTRSDTSNAFFILLSFLCIYSYKMILMAQFT
jgi:hypothetical protein